MKSLLGWIVNFWLLVVASASNEPQGFIENDLGTTLIGVTICLEAEGEDRFGNEPARYLWDLGDGRQLEGQTINFSYDTPGAYIVSLTAFDSEGLADSTPYQIWALINDPAVEATNQAPIGVIESPEAGFTFRFGDEIHFVGHGYDLEDDLIKEFYWSFADGTLATGPDVVKAYEDFCDPEDGLCIAMVTLIAQDENGLFSWTPDVVPIGPYFGDHPLEGRITKPTADEFPYDFFGERVFILKSGESITLEGEAENAALLDGLKLAWLVYGESGEDEKRGKQNQVEDEFEFLFSINASEPVTLSREDLPAEGLYLFALQVEDASGNLDPVPDFFFLEVVGDNTPPEGVDIIEPDWDLELFLDEKITLIGTAYDPEHDNVELQWTVENIDDATDIRVFCGERVIDLDFKSPGLHRISLTAFDEEGLEAEQKATCFISVLGELDFDGPFNPAPEVEPVSPFMPEIHIPVGGMVSFACEGEDEFGEAIIEYFWDFGNGHTSPKQNPGTVTYKDPGNYVVRVYAKDESNQWSEFPTYWFVQVYQGNMPPDGAILKPALNLDEDCFEEQHLFVVKVGEPFEIQGSFRDRNSSAALSGTWKLDGELYTGCLTDDCEPIDVLQTSTLSFEEPGFHVLELNVTDNERMSDPFPDLRFIHVADPHAELETHMIEPSGNITVEPGEPLYFFGFAEEENGLEAEFQWTFGPEAQTPDDLTEEELYPVVFTQESPPGQPFVVSLKSETLYQEDTTPAQVFVTVKSFQDHEFEPNDSFNEAKPIQQGSYSQFSLGAEGVDPQDIFLVTIEEDGKDFQIKVNSQQPGESLIVQVYRQIDGLWAAVEVGGMTTDSGLITLSNMPIGSYAVQIQGQTPPSKRRMGLSYSLSIATLEPSLYLPLLVEDANLSSHIGILNPTGKVADVSVQGIDEKGRTVNEQYFQLAPHARRYVSSRELFDVVDKVEQAKKIRWIKVQSTVRLMGFTNAENHEKTQLMSMGALTSLSSTLVTPHIAKQTETWYTRAVVINGADQPQPLSFKSAQAEQQLETNFVTNGQRDFRFSDVFQDLPGWGSFQAKPDQAGLAGYELFGRVDGFQEVAGLEMIDLTQKDPNFFHENGNLYFAHVAKDTQTFWTGISLINLDLVPAIYNLVAYDDNGAELTRLDNQELPVGGKLLTTTEDLFGTELSPSWIKVETIANLKGFELFGDRQTELLAGFKATGAASDRLCFPYVNVEEGKHWTGITLLNIGTLPNNTQVIAYDDNGNELERATLTIPGLTKFAKTAQSLFSSGTLPAGTGYIDVIGDQKSLIGFELFGSLESPVKLGKQFAGILALR